MSVRSPVLTAILLLTGCGESETQQTRSDGTVSVQLALNWYPEAEHGGFIAAKELGYFADEQLDVELIPGGPGAPQTVIRELAAGHIPFAIANADQVVTARAAGVNIVAVLAPLQHTPRCIIVHESSGIRSLSELKDVELAISESRIFALWMKKKLPLTNVSMIPYNSGVVGEFVTNPGFAQQGYVFSEPFVAREKGGDPHVLMLSDIGFDPYTSLLVTTEKMIADHPETVQKVVAASLKGWRNYLDSPEAVNLRIHADNPDMSLDALAFGAESMKSLCQPAEGESLCHMTIDRWNALVTLIEQVGEIEPNSVRGADCFTTQFLTVPDKP